MAKQFTLLDEMVVHAPVERCFQLSTCLEIVALELKMRPVRGRTSGCVSEGDTVLWRGWQLGLPQFHQSLIEGFRAPFFFRDRMIAGRFASFEHDHHFIPCADGSVLLRDEVRFAMRWGGIGEMIGARVMMPHIRGLLHRRLARLKRLAESEEWRGFLRPAPAGS